VQTTIQAVGLERFRLRTVTWQDDRTFAGVLQAMVAAPRQSWMIGNSWPHDVPPTLRAGSRAVLVSAGLFPAPWDR